MTDNRAHLEKINQSSLIAEPFPHFCIDDFLDADFARSVCSAFPSFQEAKLAGKEFAAVNETKFAPPIRMLNDILASRPFIERIEAMTGISGLLADPDLAGGGIHETNTGGHLDVHVDFNYIADKKWHRRVNILIYFNDDWHEDYGGYLDIWDREVKQRHGYFAPSFNRACGFVTGKYSWHGVTPVHCPPGMARRSFAVYYYTREAPPDWDGVEHSTVFRARPNEWMKGHLAMPAEHLLRDASRSMTTLKQGIKSIFRS